MSYDQRVTAVKVTAHTADGRVFEHVQPVEGSYPYQAMESDVRAALTEISDDLIEDMLQRHLVLRWTNEDR